MKRAERLFIGWPGFKGRHVLYARPLWSFNFQITSYTTAMQFLVHVENKNTPFPLETLHPNDSISAVRLKIYFELTDKNAIPPGELDSIYLCMQRNLPIRVEDIYQEMVHAWKDNSIPFSMSASQIIRNLNLPDKEQESVLLQQSRAIKSFPDFSEVQHLFASVPVESVRWEPIGIFPKGKTPYLYSGNPTQWDPLLLKKTAQWFVMDWKRAEQELFLSPPSDIYVFSRPADASGALLSNHWPMRFSHTAEMQKRPILAKTDQLISSLSKWATQVVAKKDEAQTGYMYFSLRMYEFKMPKFFSLNMMFQNIHATKQFPILKLTQRDVPLRLYSTTFDAEHVPIPDMAISEINEWAGQWTAPNCIYMYMRPEDENANFYVTIVIQPDGNIVAYIPQYANVHINNIKITTTQKWETFADEYVRPALAPILQYIEAVGISPTAVHVIGNISYSEEYIQFKRNRTISDLHQKLGKYLAPIFQTSHVAPPQINRPVVSVFMKRVAHYDQILALRQFTREYKSVPNPNMRELVSSLRNNFERITQDDINQMPRYIPKNPKASSGMYITFYFSTAEQLRIIYTDVQTAEELQFAADYVAALIHMMELPDSEFNAMVLSASASAGVGEDIPWEPLQIQTMGQLIEKRDSNRGTNTVDNDNAEEKDNFSLSDEDEEEDEEEEDDFSLSDEEEDDSSSSDEEEEEEEEDGFSSSDEEVEELEEVDPSGIEPQSIMKASPEEAKEKAEPPPLLSEAEPQTPISEKDEKVETIEATPQQAVSSMADANSSTAFAAAKSISSNSGVQKENDSDSDEYSFNPFEDSAESEETAGGGKKKNPSHPAGVNVISLKGKTSFMNERREKFDPLLYSTENVKNNNYSQKCQVNIKAQPMLLTKSEFEKQDPEAYDEFLLYGSSPDNEYYYICPRFWCFRKNKAMTWEQVQKGECADKPRPDTVLEADAAMTNIEDGHVYEFTSHMHKDIHGNYVKQNPVFQKMLTKDGIQKGVPCCGAKYHNWELFYKDRPDHYYKSPDEAKEYMRNAQNKNKPDEGGIGDIYIMRPEKIIPEKRMGNISPAMEQLFHFKNDIKPMTARTVTEFMYLVRYGVESSPTLSFLGAMADVFSNYAPGKKPMSIAEFSQYMATHITLDDFTQYNHGRFISIFADASVSPDLVLTDAEKNSNYVKKSTGSMKPFIPIAVQAYRNFIQYITLSGKDRKTPISSEFLMDVFATPNPQFFPNGLNIVIIEEVEQGKEEPSQLFIYCPKYSSYPLYDATKPTVLLYKRNHVYEPIYLYVRTTKYDLVRTFIHGNAPPLQRFFSSLANSPVNCNASTRDLEKTQSTFHPNIRIDELWERVTQENLKAVGLARNAQGNYVGIIVQYQGPESQAKEMEMFLYCQPSTWKAGKAQLPVRDVSDIPRSTYATTMEFLRRVAPVFHCAPKFTVVSDNAKEVVGIFTETYQFYPIEPAEDYASLTADIQLPIWTIHVQDYLKSAESILLPSASAESEPNNALQAETYFYNLFQRRVRVHLSSIHLFLEKKKIIDIIKTSPKKWSVSEKRTMVKEILMRIGSGLFLFADMDPSVWGNMDMEKEDHLCTTALCTPDDKWILPRRNLMDGTSPNYTGYFERIADDLVRNIRMRNYILKSDEFIYLFRIGNRVNEDEIFIHWADFKKQYEQNRRAYNADGVRNLIA